MKPYTQVTARCVTQAELNSKSGRNEALPFHHVESSKSLIPYLLGIKCSACGYVAWGNINFTCIPPWSSSHMESAVQHLQSAHEYFGLRIMAVQHQIHGAAGPDGQNFRPPCSNSIFAEPPVELRQNLSSNENVPQCLTHFESKPYSIL